jgi:23S rRNA (uracil1939-C5)-methyltransferase
VGDTILHPVVGGVRLHVGPASFFQVNPDVNALLVQAVTAACEGASRVVDLYAGVGNLGLPVAKATGAQVLLVESHPQAAADARKAARANQLEAEVQTADADAFRAGDAWFDVAILDPPRIGAPGVLAQLATTLPRRIVYVSCNPTAMARDLRAMKDAGYEPERVVVFDMFPQTDHVETLCILGRST